MQFCRLFLFKASVFIVFTILVVAPLSKKSRAGGPVPLFVFVVLCLGESPAALLNPISTSSSLYFSLFSVSTVSSHHYSLHCSKTPSLLSSRAQYFKNDGSLIERSWLVRL